MKLHRKGPFTGIKCPLVRAVVGVYKALFRTDFFKTFALYGVAVVLARYVHTTATQFLYRLVYSPVAVFELFGLCSGGESQKLMPEAYSEHRNFAEELSYLLNNLCVIGRISRSVRKHHSVKSA